MWRIILIACLIAGRPALGQHVHGGAKLTGLVDGTRLVLEFEAPLEDLVGFERAPANDRERAAIDALNAYLKSGEGFTPSAAARCRLGGATSDIVAPRKGHAEVRTSLVYECAEMRALKEISLGVFGQFGKLKRVDASVATGKGRAQGRLTPRSRVLGL